MTDNIPHYTGLAENPKNSITKARKFPQNYQIERKENVETTLLWSVRDKSKLYTSNTETTLLWSIPG